MLSYIWENVSIIITRSISIPGPLLKSPRTGSWHQTEMYSWKAHSWTAELWRLSRSWASLNPWRAIHVSARPSHSSYLLRIREHDNSTICNVHSCVTATLMLSSCLCLCHCHLQWTVGSISLTSNTRLSHFLHLPVRGKYFIGKSVTNLDFYHRGSYIWSHLQDST